jgi:hypothetical protein
MFQQGQIGYVDGTEQAEIVSVREDGRLIVRELNTEVLRYGLDPKRFLPEPLERRDQ